MADRRDLMSTLTLVLLLIIGEVLGDGCGIFQMERQILSYLRCAKGQEFVNLSKKVDNLEEACSKDIEIYRDCEIIHFTTALEHCITEDETKATRMVSRMALSKNRFLCDGEFSIIREFWDNDGINCQNESTKLFQKYKCYDLLPFFLDDYYQPYTCNKQLEYLQCIRDHFSATCNDFTRKVVYTYIKRSVLATPCKETLIKEDKTDLEILSTTIASLLTEPLTHPPTHPLTELPTEAEQTDSNSSPSVVSNAFILSLTLFITGSMIYC